MDSQDVLTNSIYRGFERLSSIQEPESGLSVDSALFDTVGVIHFYRPLQRLYYLFDNAVSSD